MGSQTELVSKGLLKLEAVKSGPSLVSTVILLYVCIGIKLCDVLKSENTLQYSQKPELQNSVLSVTCLYIQLFVIYLSCIVAIPPKSISCYFHVEVTPVMKGL